MDFRRPSKFNKDQLHTLEMLHDTFSRLGGTYLSSALRCMSDITVLGAEQVTYGEFIASLPVPALTAIVELEPLGTNAIIAFDLPLVFSMIDRLLGGAGAATYRLRELTDIELSLSRTVVTRLLDELSTSWNELVGVDFTLRQTEMNPQFAQIAPPTELSVLLSFQIRIHESSGVMALCLPYRSIESVAPSLTTQSYFSGQRSVDPSFSLAGGLEGVDIELRAEVGAVDLRIEDVLALRPGDIVPLGIPVEEGVRLMAGQHEVYRAFPGAYQRHLAVQITERTGVAIGSARGLSPRRPRCPSPSRWPRSSPHDRARGGRARDHPDRRGVGQDLATLSGTEATVEDLSVVPRRGCADRRRRARSSRPACRSPRSCRATTTSCCSPTRPANLAKAMMGDAYPGDGGELTEIELSAIAEAMNQMMGGACSALADELSIEADIAPPEVKVLEEGDDVAEIADAVYMARFKLVRRARGRARAAHLPGLRRPPVRDALVGRAGPRDRRRAARSAAAASDDADLQRGRAHRPDHRRVRRRGAHDAASARPPRPRSRRSRSTPTTRWRARLPADRRRGGLRLRRHRQQPLRALARAGLQLAAIMMGLREPMGDGLSEMELSAVSEAMNQMMGAATNVMADTLTMAIEVRRRPAR